MSDTKESASGLSRRQFLRGSGAAAAATALTGVPVTPPTTQAAGGAGGGNVPAHGPAAVKINLNVNGRAMSTSVEPRVTLLDALRNYLDVTGCKRVCDRGTCGACTVLADGKPIYSCTMLAVEAQGKKTYFEVFKRYDLEAVDGATSYESIARDLRISVDDVKNYLTRSREEFRNAVRSILCESVGSPEDLSQEWEVLFGGA